MSNKNTKITMTIRYTSFVQ